jgi:hypothetical protein
MSLNSGPVPNGSAQAPFFFGCGFCDFNCRKAGNPEKSGKIRKLSGVVGD